MMFQNRFIPVVVLFILFSLGSCKNSGNRADDKDPGQNQVSQAPEIPGATPELIQKLLDECTGIDYIFDNWPISMSQDEDPSIDQNILFIDLKRPVGQIPPHCRKEGRKFLKMGAEEAFMVDFYFGEGCNFYVFRDKKNMPLYANYMTSAGVNFYQNIFNQVKTTIQSQ
jgi:hypothetical protein